MKWHLTQIGSRENYLYPRIINNKGLLGSFSTDIWFNHVHQLPLRGKLMRLKSRYHSDLKNVKVHSKNLNSIYRMFFPYKGNRFDQLCTQGENFSKWAIKNIVNNGLNSGDSVFGYTCASLEIAKIAKQSGAKMILGQFDPAFYWYDIQRVESEKWHKVNNQYYPSQNFKDRVLEEWHLADTIIVNSKHCKDVLLPYGVDQKKVKILPLPVSIDIKSKINPKKLNSDKIKILFVGNISFGKGFAYFAEAKKLLENDSRFEFFAIGDLHIENEVVKKNKWNLNFTGRLNKQELTEFYLKAHILVFPTLSEGFGQVQLEAMSFGLPVISTEKCGNVVVNNYNGKIVKEGSASEIFLAINEIVEHTQIYEEMSYNALNTVSNYSFKNIEESFWNLFG